MIPYMILYVVFLQKTRERRRRIRHDLRRTNAPFWLCLCGICSSWKERITRNIAGNAIAEQPTFRTYILTHPYMAALAPHHDR